jgi:CHAD domain-containing protein
MGFSFQKDESMARAIPRLVCERVDHARKCLRNCSRAEAVHCARKDVKKIRAVLRLTRASIPKKDFQRVARLLRAAAAEMAGPRDAHVKAQAVSLLAKHFKTKITPGAFRQVRARLRRDAAQKMRAFTKASKTVIRSLARVRREAERLDLSEKGWSAIAPGVRRAYSEGHKCFTFARKSGQAEDFHQWRKAAKDLWYHITLLNPIWPEQLQAVETELDNLGEALGDDHDLFVLHETLQALADDVPHSEATLLHGLIIERQRELRIAALELGERFYAETPDKFCNRLGKYWRAWRRDKLSDPARVAYAV